MINRTKCIIKENAELYITEEMYKKNKSFFINVPETGELNVTNKMLTEFRQTLKDSTYSVSKIYGFKTKKETSIILKKEHFALPDFKFHVKLKDENSNELEKKIFNFSFSIFENNRKVDEDAPNNIDDFSGRVGYIKNISAKINLKSLTHAFENFFYMT